MHTRKWFLFIIGLTLGVSVLGESKSLPKPRPINSKFRLEIQFVPGGSEISPAYDKDIRQVVDYMNNYPYTQCDIRGYTDNVGTDAVNVKLSQERADNVRLYMIHKLGVSADRVAAHGLGKEEPVASNETENGRKQNRRIIAVITGQPPT